MAQPRDKLLPRLTTAFFDRPRITAILWIALTVFGIFSYTTLLRREGFPSVDIPLAVVNGTYFVNDASKVDNDVARVISDAALKQSSVSTVQTQSSDNFFNVAVQYKDGTDAKAAAKDLEKTVQDSNKLPKNAQVQYNVPYFGATGGDIQQIDLAISFFSKDNSADTAGLTKQAEAAAKWLNDRKIPGVEAVFVKNPFENVTDPTSGKSVAVQRSFDRFGERVDTKTSFYGSVLIGVSKQDNTDDIKLDQSVRDALAKLRTQPEFKNNGAEVSASFAPNIKDNISELQRVLLEGLLAVLVVGSIVIAIRASFIIVVSMITVLVATLGVLFLIGYTLNVITLFALILGLSLIVDDTIIMVEAIDAARRKQTDRRAAVKEATRKVSRAMVAATATAALSFAPLLFVGGVLGSFIKAIPVTIILSLIISLLVALIFIPLLARWLLLGKKQMGARGVKEVAAGVEAKIAHNITHPMKWARHSTKRLFLVGGIAMFIGFGFIAAGIFLSKNVIFNIFPPTKDTNGVVLSLAFPANTTVAQAEEISAEADKLAEQVIGENFVQSSYFQTGTAQSAVNQVTITSYTKRDIASPQIVKQLQDRFDKDFKKARVTVAQTDLGPPASAFIIQVDAANRSAAFTAANDISSYLSSVELKRPSGKVAHLTNVNVSSQDSYLRTGGKPIVTVSAGFDGDDTTTLVNLAQDAVKKEFPESRVQGYGLPANAIQFDLGQESENQDSFKTLVLAFPVLLVVIFILLAFQFRSFLQPLLIFMAIPFSLFGIMLGLDLTNNPISFFAMLGFFALIGLSIKNTILLTDFANQSKLNGLSAIDSVAAALEERFRPLFATSVTAVVSLIPLAISSPFWQGLAVVLIFGLLSSTFLVITVFPYYYLGGEYLRYHIKPKHFFIWLLLTVVVTVIVSSFSKSLGLLVLPFSLLLVIYHAVYVRWSAYRRKKIS